MTSLLSLKQIYTGVGYMLGNIILLVILLVMMFALCYVGYKTNEYKYNRRKK